jgi:uncharacterized protein (DUF433 family)
MNSLELITIDPDIMGGVPVFAGTRVPIQALVDYLSDGDTVDTFVDDFPTVTREQALAVMKEALEAWIPHASAA